MVRFFTACIVLALMVTAVASTKVRSGNLLRRQPPRVLDEQAPIPPDQQQCTCFGGPAKRHLKQQHNFVAHVPRAHRQDDSYDYEEDRAGTKLSYHDEQQGSVSTDEQADSDCGKTSGKHGKGGYKELMEALNFEVERSCCDVVCKYHNGGNIHFQPSKSDEGCSSIHHGSNAFVLANSASKKDSTDDDFYVKSPSADDDDFYVSASSGDDFHIVIDGSTRHHSNSRKNAGKFGKHDKAQKSSKLDQSRKSRRSQPGKSSERRNLYPVMSECSIETCNCVNGGISFPSPVPHPVETDLSGPIASPFSAPFPASLAAPFPPPSRTTPPPTSQPTPIDASLLPSLNPNPFPSTPTPTLVPSSLAPSAQPSLQLTSAPPTPFPTLVQSPASTSQPSLQPTSTPVPSLLPTTVPIPRPTANPTSLQPNLRPKDQPTPLPTFEPTPQPSLDPSPFPRTPELTRVPTKVPTPEAVELPVPTQSTPFSTPFPPGGTGGGSSELSGGATNCKNNYIETCLCGDEIKVSFSHCDPDLQDWLGLYPCKDENTSTYNYHPTMWLWTCYHGACVEGSTMYHNTLVFNDTLPAYTDFGPHQWPLPSGCYVAVLNRNYGLSPPPYEIIMASEEFYV